MKYIKLLLLITILLFVIDGTSSRELKISLPLIDKIKEALQLWAEKKETEAALLKAEELTARLEAYQEEAARLKAEEEEAVRLKAEEEAAILKAERLKAEEDAARLKAEEEEAVRLQTEQEEASRLKIEEETPPSSHTAEEYVTMLDELHLAVCGDSCGDSHCVRNVDRYGSLSCFDLPDNLIALIIKPTTIVMMENTVDPIEGTDPERVEVAEEYVTMLDELPLYVCVDECGECTYDVDGDGALHCFDLADNVMVVIVEPTATVLLANTVVSVESSISMVM